MTFFLAARWASQVGAELSKVHEALSQLQLAGTPVRVHSRDWVPWVS